MGCGPVIRSVEKYSNPVQTRLFRRLGHPSGQGTTRPAEVLTEDERDMEWKRKVIKNIHYAHMPEGRKGDRNRVGYECVCIPNIFLFFPSPSSLTSN